LSKDASCCDYISPKKRRMGNEHLTKEQELEETTVGRSSDDSQCVPKCMNVTSDFEDVDSTFKTIEEQNALLKCDESFQYLEMIRLQYPRDSNFAPKLSPMINMPPESPYSFLEYLFDGSWVSV
jgi:hypothetical protein